MDTIEKFLPSRLTWKGVNKMYMLATIIGFFTHPIGFPLTILCLLLSNWFGLESIEQLGWFGQLVQAIVAVI